MPSYVTPRTLTQAIAALSSEPTIIAGGTDIYPSLVGRDVPADVLDVSRLDELRGITHDAGWTRFGASTTWSEVAGAALPPDFRALQQAALQIGAVQVQNAGTIAGNICTASPAGDSIPVLLALDAVVELCGTNGTRQIALADFVTGYRTTAKRADEIVVAILVPDANGRRRSAFVKHGGRSHLVISMVMVAAAITRDESNAIVDARVAVGACSPVAVRLRSVERQIVESSEASDGPGPVRVTGADLGDLSPIDDVRCTGRYRLRVVPHLVQRAVAECEDHER